MDSIHNIFIYITLLIILFYISLKKNGINSASTYCVGIWLFSSFCSLFFYYNAFDYRNFSNISLLPFLYIFVLFYITLYPILKFDSSRSTEMVINGKVQRLLYYFIIFTILVSVEPWIEHLFYLRRGLQDSSVLADIYLDREEGVASLSPLSWLGRKFNYINSFLAILSPILLFYYITFTRKLNKWIVIGLIMATTNPWLAGFVGGGRSNMLQSALHTVFIFFIFAGYMNGKMKNTIIKYGIIIGAIFVLLVGIISISRYKAIEDKINIDVWTSLSLYGGEGILNFNVDMWDMSQTSNGDKNFSFVKKLLFLDPQTDLHLLREQMEHEVPVNTKIFYTYIGALYYDLNKYGTFIFLFIMGCWITLLTKKRRNKMTLDKVFLLCIWGKLLTSGVMFSPYSVFNAQIQVVIVLVVYLLLRYNYKRETVYRLKPDE